MRLTDQIIKRLPLPRYSQITFDDAVKGFGIRIAPTGARTFILAYRRKRDGKQRRFTIGPFGAWNTTQAREEAKRLKRE
ncbi:MAG TPA: Arm DNA-binding domain-containing protein, partial [Pseudolabrys sp.]|nr:Arm DNA-binding domain-containing protein [Pseudolabrys sp.]